LVFVIGIDPHKASHTAAVIDGDEQLLGEFWVRADRRQRDRLLSWAAVFEPRVWAVEGASGVGALLARQLVGAGESVLDVPPALSARARLLDGGRQDKTDAHDARSAAIVALRSRNLRAVRSEDHAQVLRPLARRHHQLIAARTRAICRLCELTAGGLAKNLSAKRAASELRKLRPADAIANGSLRSSSTRSAISTQPSPSCAVASTAPLSRPPRASPRCMVSVRSSRATGSDTAATSPVSRLPATMRVTTRPR
jgi:Transposase